MKVRFEDDSIRLRLKQKEVDDFFDLGRISSTCRLGIQAQNYLRFTLKKDTAEKKMRLVFETNEIVIMVPELQANTWVQSDQEGMQAFMPVDENHQLQIIVEKDFRCLHKSPGSKEDEDSFPNPLENGKRC